MDKKEILADLRRRFGDVTVLYAKDIGVLLSSPSTGAVYELIKRGGLPFPVKPVGGRPAAAIYDVADWLAGDTEPRPKATEPEDKAALPTPKYKVGNAMAKAMALLRDQCNFLSQVEAELNKILMANELAAKAKADARADAGGKAGEANQPTNIPRAKRTLKTRPDII